MRPFSQRFDRDTQDQFLACFDRQGVPVKLTRLIALINRHAPELAGEDRAEAAFDAACELWTDRQIEQLAEVAAGEPSGGELELAAQERGAVWNHSSNQERHHD
jgi:hypothetical protein